jgi:protein SCO1
MAAAAYARRLHEADDARDIARMFLPSSSRTTRSPLKQPAHATAWARRVATLAAVSGAMMLAACEQRAIHGTPVDPPITIPVLELTTANGTPVRLGARTEGPTVVFFGYTHCPDVCPTTLSDWKRIRTKLGEDGARVRFVFVSVDPQRDTPEIAAKYAAGFDPSFIGVSGDSATTARVQATFMVASSHHGSPSGSHTMPQAATYEVMHSGQSFLLDAEGRLVAIYSFGNGHDALAADLERVL